MERLAEMMTFAKVVETKSFSSAAHMLNTSKSLVSKQVSSLESALGVRLLNRTTRRMSLTEIGAAYYEHCVRISHEIDAATQTVTQLQAEPRGVLRITSPVIFASLHLAPALRTFLQRHENVEVELNASDRMVDIVDEGYDLAIRITDHPAPAMVARKIAPVRWVTVASPEYLARHGTPHTPQDLLNHQCLLYQGIPAPRSGGWHYRIGNKEVVLPISGKCRVNNSEVLLQLALDGMGIVLFPTYILGRYLKSGRLKVILPDSEANPDTSLYATYMPNRYMQPKVRAFIDHLMEHFGPQPDWDRF
ncbi:LysR family transcriptional regulator [Noviherbaspirillum cavernae]|uniref:LysR family transcriptional regulator n=1 Tax=Noviherbaspirillum cavernae TaxID=2320862 RepID=A0A418X3E0_9BURK|nr:LysR family transcriptional regulator [Noviherbaspirillum cavernae]RJG06982.1 LysR family transcriptional regulator [Noviherbaspirillum cavernae]